MWSEKSVFYQIYPLGFCGAPFENDGILTNRIQKVSTFIPHIKKLGADAIYFSPVFESDTHGYNTRDYKKIDSRLGQTMILRRSATAYIRRASGLFLTAFSTMWGAASSVFWMF